jgi:hypothetical protein
MGLGGGGCCIRAGGGAQQVEFGTHYAPHAGGEVRFGPSKVGIEHAGEQVRVLHHTVPPPKPLDDLQLVLSTQWRKNQTAPFLGNNSQLFIYFSIFDKYLRNISNWSAPMTATLTTTMMNGFFY